MAGRLGAETIERLKQENDHMARALDFQREGLTKLVGVMVEETKKIGTFTIEGSRRLDETAAARKPVLRWTPPPKAQAAE